MKKGVSAMQNLQLLKWCMEFGIKADWNVLWGFPGEDPAEYERMALMVPLLTHLQPPARGSRIRLDRHSPNFREAESMGFRRVRPYPAYFDVYDTLPPDAVRNLAYFFDADDGRDAEISGYTRSLSHAIEQWRSDHAGSAFFYLEQEGGIVLVDSRPFRHERRTQVLPDLPAKLFLLCDTARASSALVRQLPGVPPAQIGAALEKLCEDGVMWSDGQRFLSLAVDFTAFLESRKSKHLEQAVDQVLTGYADARAITA
jgi:hypothetical protein